MDELKFWQKLKIKTFGNWEDRYFICYFKGWILCTAKELEDNSLSWVLYTNLVSWYDWDGVDYSTEYKDYGSIIWEYRKVEIDWKTYGVEIKDNY